MITADCRLCFTLLCHKPEFADDRSFASVAFKYLLPLGLESILPFSHTSFVYPISETMFKALTLIACLATTVLADNTPAQIITDNAQGAVYLAPIDGGKGPIIGNVQVVALPGLGTQVIVTLNNFDLKDSLDYSEYRPSRYHAREN